MKIRIPHNLLGPLRFLYTFYIPSRYLQHSRGTPSAQPRHTLNTLEISLFYYTIYLLHTYKTVAAYVLGTFIYAGADFFIPPN